MDAMPICRCGSADCRRYEPTGLEMGQLTRLANAGFKFDKKYPYVSNRLPLRLDGHPHTKTGKTVVMSKQAEREICAAQGMFRE